MKSVMSAIRHEYSLIVAYTGIQAYCRKGRGFTKKLVDNLMPCYLYQRDPSGVDSNIFYACTVKFIEEVNRQKVPLITWY